MDFQWVQFPPGQGSLQPVAIGAVVEVTILPKPSMEKVASGDLASMQAVTRVNAEQASKQVMREPTGRATGKAAVADFRGANSIPSAVPPGYWRRHACTRRFHATREAPRGGSA